MTVPGTSYEFMQSLTTSEKNHISELFHEAKTRSGFRCEYALRFENAQKIRCEIEHTPTSGVFDRESFGHFTRYIARLFKNSRIFSPDGKESEMAFHFVDGTFRFTLESYR